MIVSLKIEKNFMYKILISCKFLIINNNVLTLTNQKILILLYFYNFLDF